MQPGLKRLNKGRPPKYAVLEATLLEWVKERRNNQQAVSRKMIQVKARTFAREREWQTICPGIKDFVFSHKWLDSWMAAIT